MCWRTTRRTRPTGYDTKKAKYLLKAFVDLHKHTIAKKVSIIIEHFKDKVARRIENKAKAMIVTRSRLHAVPYRLEVDRYLKEKGYPFKALVALSGEVKDGGNSYTESNMNGFPEAQTANTFDRDEYRLLIVAKKFQTGFDQPLLHTMYVDRKLSGVHAVQTLSRLNRVYPPHKTETMMLDFSNDFDGIQKSFQPYYDRIILSEPTDPNTLYDFQNRLLEFGFYSEDEVRLFAEAFFDPRGTQAKLYAILDPVVTRFKGVEKEEQASFRGLLGDYVRLYAFLSQVITFQDVDLEMLYVFGRLLKRRLPALPDSLPRDIQENIDMDSFRIQQTSDGKIPLERGQDPVPPPGVAEGQGLPAEEREALSRIVHDLNERFGTDFSDDDRVVIQQLEDRLDGDPAIDASMRVNPPEKFRLTFDQKAKDLMQDMVESNFRFYKKVHDDQVLGKYLLERLFQRFLQRSVTRQNPI
jgi:type I restriction enzyme R subunit